MRLIQSRSAVAALQFGWRNLDAMWRWYWWLFAFGAVLDGFAGAARVPFLPSAIVNMASVMPALFTTMSFVDKQVSNERRTIGAALTVAPLLISLIVVAALARALRLELIPAPVALLLALALSVLQLKILPLGFIYAFDDAPIGASLRKTWLAVTGLDWWNILGIFFISGLCIVPVSLFARLISALPGAAATARTFVDLAIIGLNAWAFLSLGAFSSTYSFATELPLDPSGQPQVQTQRGARLNRTPRWFKQRSL